MNETIFCASDSQKGQFDNFTQELNIRLSPKDFSKEDIPKKGNIILLGGDGSLNYLANNIPKDGEYNIIYLPTGTANDFAKSLKREAITPMLAKINDIIDHSPTFRVPLMMCNDRLFINVATGGAPALVTSDSESLLKNLTGKFDYYLKGLEKAFDPEVFNVSYQIDQQEWQDEKLYGLSVAQGLYAGGGAKVSDSYAPLFKDQFNFMAIKEGQMSQALMDVLEIQKESQKDYSDSVITHYVKELKLKSDKEIPFKLDGEPFQSKEISFKKSGRFLNFYQF